MAIFRPGAVAKRQQVSDSYIRKLFGGERTSFSEYVLVRRRVLAHHMLIDQRWTGVGIASIAYDAGFGNLSHFNRAFKRCYGTTPSEVRDAIKSEDKFRNGGLANLATHDPVMNRVPTN